MKILVSIILLLSTVVAHADTPNSTFEYVFNHLSGIPAALKWSLGSKIREAHNQAVCVYDYATSGGAVSTINLKATDLKTPCVLPAKSVILNGVLDVSASFSTAGTPSVSFGYTGSVAAFKSSAAASTITSSAPLQMIPNWVVANAVKLGATASYNVTMTVTSAALTKGHARVFLNYAQGE